MHEKIYLCGMMGSGKTTVAPLLAQKLGWTSVDIDVLAERKAGMSVAEIFRQKGEATFRKLENEVLLGVQSMSSVVVALGGGALEHSGDLVRGFGRLIYLKAATSTLKKRIESETSKRPLLRGDTSATLSTLLARREADYLTCDWTVATDDLTPQQVAAQIWEMIA